jgi:proline iminopeptidase
MPRWLLLLTGLCCGCAAAGPPAGAPPVREGYAAGADGVRLHYHAYGTGRDTVVLVHGQQGNAHDYLAPDLAPLAAGRVLLAYTQRGGGRSTPVDAADRLRIEDHVLDLEALRAHFGLERLSLLAHSGGAAVAARYAMAYPERVERMLLFAVPPPARAAYYEEATRRFMVRFDSATLVRLGADVDALRTAADPVAVCRRLHGTVLRSAYLVDVARADGMRGDFCTAPPERLRTERARLAAFQQSLGDWDWTEALQAMRVPVLVLHGEQDAIPAAAAEAWVRALRDARLLVVSGADHFPHLDAPERFFPAAETFFRGGWPAEAVRAP